MTDIGRLEQDYLNAVECGSEDVLAIWDELIAAYEACDEN